MSLARQLAGKGVAETKARRAPSQVRREGEPRSLVARPVSFQQNLIKASNTAGRRFGADVSVAQWRLSAVELDRALRQRSDGRDTTLSVCCPDGGAARAARGELEAGPDHQFPLEAADTHGRVGQDQSQGPEADYGPQGPGLCLGQREGAWGTGSLEQVFFFYTVQFFRSKEGRSDCPPLPRALDDRGSCMQPLDVSPS